MYKQLKEELARREEKQENVQKLMPLVRYMENPVRIEEFPHVKSIEYAHDFGETPMRMTLYIDDMFTVEQYESLRASVRENALLKPLSLELHIVHEDDNGNRYNTSNFTKQHTEKLVANHAHIADVTFEGTDVICIHLASGCAMNTLSTEQSVDVYELGFSIVHNVFNDGERSNEPLVYTKDGV